jgi:hypothetical protein
MKFLVTLLLIAVSVVPVLAQSKDEQNVIDAIKVMDRQWIIEAYSSTDLADFDRIVADDFMITGANGKIVDKAAKRSNVKKDYSEDPSSGGVFRIDADSHKVRLLDKDMAVSTGFIIEKYTWKTQVINGHVHFTNVYLKRKGKWQVVQSHFTNIKQV